MKTERHAWLLVAAAFLLGTAAMTLTSGCQPAATSPEDDRVTPPIVEVPEPAADPLPAEPDPAPEPETPVDDPVDEAEVPEEAEQPEPAEQPMEEEAAPEEEEAEEEPAQEQLGARVTEPAIDPEANAPIEPGDWPQWGGTSFRNNTPIAPTVPLDWNIGGFDREGNWLEDEAENIKWVVPLGSQTYGNPVVADGRVFVGTNNGAGYMPRYPPHIDLGVLLAFREEDGKFLWQHSSEKLPTGRVHDWPLQGICSSPLIIGDRLWFTTSRGEVRCLDTHGFYNGEDTGPVTNERGRLFNIDASNAEQHEAALAALEEGEVTDYMLEEFERVEMPLAEGIQIESKDDGQWVGIAHVNGAEREIHFNVEGTRLAVYKIITTDDLHEADTVWVLDMMTELGVSQHNMANCSPTAYGDILFIITSNGVDESHINIPAPDAPSFIAVNKHTGEVYWTDNSPGTNILHGSWSAPAVAELGGVPQAIFPGGDGWIYSFRADEGQDGKPELLWKFDANPKDSVWILGGRGTRNNIIGTPVIYDGLVYIAVGQDPEHGEGIGHLWCIDPTKRGDVSPQLAMRLENGERKEIPPRRLQNVIPEEGEVAVDNPNSAVVWHYSQYDQDGDGIIDFHEEMHRTIGTAAIKDDLVFIADFSGLVHCLDAKGDGQGGPKVHWTYDLLSATWGSPLIADGHVFIGDEDGDLTIFELTDEPHEPVNVIHMGSSIYSTPVYANGVLYISTKDKLFAIATEESEAAFQEMMAARGEEEAVEEEAEEAVGEEATEAPQEAEPAEAAEEDNA